MTASVSTRRPPAAEPAMIDERLLNWQHAVPDAARRLLLPVGSECWPNARRVTAGSATDLAAALAPSLYDGIAAPALQTWSAAVAVAPEALLTRLAGALAPGGWLYCGLTPRWSPLAAGRRESSPLAAGRRESSSLRRATTLMQRRGLQVRERWIVLPSLQCPAFLIPADDRAELDYFLGALFFPYVAGKSGLTGRSMQAAQRLGRRAARRAPARLRIRLAPAVAVLGVRP